MYLVVLHLALCCVTVLLQMTRRSPKGKNIITSDQSTPIAKWTRLSSQSSKDSNCERFRTSLNSHIYSSIFDVASPTVEHVVEFNTLKTTFVPQIFESRDWVALFENFGQRMLLQYKWPWSWIDLLGERKGIYHQPELNSRNSSHHKTLECESNSLWW